MWFLAYLLIVYATVGAKIAGAITAPWGVVLAPVWVPLLAGIVTLLMFGITRERM